MIETLTATLWEDKLLDSTPFFSHFGLQQQQLYGSRTAFGTLYNIE